ncbi:MAG: hypothetical protein ACSHYA_11840 [Opitutaceae bacterium]
MTIKTFKTLTEVGRGRLLFQTESDEISEELYIATTNEYVVCRGDEEIILPSQAAAIRWAVNNDLCPGKLEFLQRCIEVVRIPLGSTIPKVRPQYDAPNQDGAPVDPELRIKELMQHPIYNTCIVQHDDGEDLIRLTNKQRKKVINYVKHIFDVDYYYGEHARLQNSLNIGYTDNQVGMQKFHVNDQRKARRHKMPHLVRTEIETFSVFSGNNLPDYFKKRDFDEVTWLKIDSKYSHDKKALTNRALIAVAVNIHYQMNYEFRQHSTSMDPMETLQGLGMRPYEKTEEFSLLEELINFIASKIRP